MSLGVPAAKVLEPASETARQNTTHLFLWRRKRHPISIRHAISMLAVRRVQPAGYAKLVEAVRDPGHCSIDPACCRSSQGDIAVQHTLQRADERSLVPCTRCHRCPCPSGGIGSSFSCATLIKQTLLVAPLLFKQSFIPARSREDTVSANSQMIRMTAAGVYNSALRRT